MTKQERVLFAQGWVSSQMAAERLGVHVVTIHRLVHDGKIKARDTQKVGRSRFIRMTALAEVYDLAIRKAFKLDDWSDIQKKMQEA